MQVVFLLAVVAFAAVCVAQPPHPLNTCVGDSDCNQWCPNNTGGVCSPPEKHCHCHDVEISCKSDDICKQKCVEQAGCCHNQDHCHCGEETCGPH